MAFTALVGGLSLLGSAFRLSMLPIAILLVLIQAGALWWRRTQPVAVLIVVVLAGLAWAISIPPREASAPALPFAVYAVSVYGAGRMRLWVAAIAMAVIVVSVALLLLGEFDAARTVIPAGATSLVAWVIGDYIRSRRQFMLDLVARHKQEREQAAEEERLRIARELHDVVAHNVSVMAIQAGAARVSGNAGDETLVQIEQGARDTLAELNKLLGVLRKTPSSPDLAPQPRLDDADALLKPARDAGLEATLKVTGVKRPLPAALDLSAYRIIQEAVTNVLKHANANRLEVVVDYQTNALTLTISDNGSGAADTTATKGHGLIGMRERVQMFGGDLSIATSSLGGFTVRTTLPVKT